MRPVGRPKRGPEPETDQNITVRMPMALVRILDALAERDHRSRSAAVIVLVESALSAADKALVPS